MTMVIRTISELPEGWKEEVLQMSDEGCNKAELLEFLAVPIEVHGRFIAESQEYADVFLRCQMKHDAYWHRLFRENVDNKKSFDVSGWHTYMKENCGYGDNKRKRPPTKKEAVQREELKARFLKGKGGKDEKNVVSIR